MLQEICRGIDAVANELGAEPPASPWQNSFAERLIGSIRRECLDHFIVSGEAHLRQDSAIVRTLLQTSERIDHWIRMRRSLAKSQVFDGVSLWRLRSRDERWRVAARTSRWLRAGGGHAWKGTCLTSPCAGPEPHSDYAARWSRSIRLGSALPNPLRISKRKHYRN
jgi:hypothetical protein